MANAAIKPNQSGVLEAPSEEGEIQAGNPLPIGGAHQVGDGVNFVLFSRHATRVRLELYQNTGDLSPARIIDLDPARHRTGDVWHVWVRGIPRDNSMAIASKDRINRNKGIASTHISCFWIHSQEQSPASRNWDFCAARGYDSSSALSDLSISTVDNAGTTPKCIFTDDHFDWEMDSPPKHSASDTVIYETHVRGFTIHPSSGVDASRNLHSA